VFFCIKSSSWRKDLPEASGRRKKFRHKKASRLLRCFLRLLVYGSSGSPLLILNTGVMKNLQKNENWMVAEVQLSYKSRVPQSQQKKVTSSRDAYEIFRASWDEDKIEFIEQAKMLLLSRGNRVLGIYEIASGGIDAVVMDLRIAFSAALLAKASAIILAHNHPSGQLKPSDADLSMFRKFVDAGKLLQIDVLDSLILTSEGYLSFSDTGLD
jgi:DNA repair protein RadC